MDVHHHPMAIGSHHGKKKWTAYFWEFLMLFLAVFCGFLAENFREHQVEHQREKKFARRLLSDLKEDSSFINKRIGRLQERKIKYAEFLSVMTGPAKSSDFNVMKAFDPLLKSYKSQFTTTTYNQMKTSGSLRYIDDDSLTTTLQRYYEITVPRASVDADGIDMVFRDQVTPYLIKHFQFQHLIDTIPTLTEQEARMFNRTADSDQEFINIMGLYQGACDGLLAQQKPALDACKKLIGMIEKEYHLK